eukprot:scaffold83753_cov14-Tisochrysis_lutea.AAC.1
MLLATAHVLPNEARAHMGTLTLFKAWMASNWSYDLKKAEVEPSKGTELSMRANDLAELENRKSSLPPRSWAANTQVGDNRRVFTSMADILEGRSRPRLFRNQARS